MERKEQQAAREAKQAAGNEEKTRELQVYFLMVLHVIY
jgi:hypothetical protein